ncbi:regulatory protein RecX [Segatella bryantii]|jgi:regulatory protein|uniref:Regulatory protein RecX n=1 Tax=Segatella bryantii TaxID=77095 RepID=A0ABX4EI44_SEGBR|nr:regulatory protein RecX [Segatella bryantii]MBQ3858518.1 RecX family transcriptional regulator [Prevotella sp.]OYP55794.1 RecX family transcriptional regulator [Segatella bryantii]UKK81015.1 RecX family transcriptional regulator [Segatella bryantii]SDL43928.1 regulatory protein [Segatella bryantii]
MKPISEQQALFKLTKLCSQSEHCSQEMLEKMKKWELEEDAIARNMEYLIREKYVDDSRFARFFINDKIKYNKWGRKKVEQALYLKHISKDISDPIFEEIDNKLYLDVLRPILQSKRKSIKAKNDYELNIKLIKFAMGRGFSMDLIKKCLNHIDDIPDNDF